MITCSCRDSSCKSNIRISGDECWVTNSCDKETLIYLNANRKVALIRELLDSLVPDDLKNL